MTPEPVDKLSEVLVNLHELNSENAPEVVQSALTRQIELLRSVQEQMQTQLKLHDAQIAALREVIVLLGGGAG